MIDHDLRDRIKKFIENDLGYSMTQVARVDIRPLFLSIEYFPDPSNPKQRRTETIYWNL